MKKTLKIFGALAGAAAITGCASYHALPLPTEARLAGNLTGLRHTWPDPQGDAADIDVSRPLNVDQIGFLAILNSPQLISERGEQETAQATLEQSTLLPNPSVSLGYAALLGGPGTAGAVTASLSQDIASLVTYRRRVAAARAQADQVNANLLWQEWQVAQKARLLAVDLYWEGRSIAASEAELAQISETADAVGQAVSQNDLDLTVLSPLQDTRATTAQALETLRQTALSNWQQLNALLGLKPDVRFAIAEPAVPMPSFDADTIAADIQARRPDLVALQLGYRSADESVRAAILGQFPAFILGGTWNSDTSNVRSAGPTATFDLPIFNRNQGQVAQARASRLLLQEQYQQQLDDTVGTILGLRTQSARIEAALTEARRAADAAQARADVARTAYRQRNIDQRTLTDFVTVAMQRRLEVIDLERGLAEAHVALTLELGLGLPSTRMAPLDPEKSI
jgi:outer membrane protein TolC